MWANLGLSGTSIDYFVVSPQERFLAVTTRESEIVRVIDLATGRTLAELPGHADYAREGSSRDGSVLTRRGGLWPGARNGDSLS